MSSKNHIGFYWPLRWTPQYFQKKFAHKNMKKPPSKVAHNQPNFFFSTALSYPYGLKLKMHIVNWTEAPSVISTLWFHSAHLEFHYKICSFIPAPQFYIPLLSTLISTKIFFNFLRQFTWTYPRILNLHLLHEDPKLFFLLSLHVFLS